MREADLGMALNSLGMAQLASGDRAGATWTLKRARAALKQQRQGGQ